MPKSSDNNFDSFSVLLKLIEYKKQLSIIGISAFLLSIIVSVILPVKYESQVVLFPAPSIQISKALLSDNNQTSVFGSEEEVEQLLQTLNSNSVSEKIIAKHNLFKHYEIDSTESKSRSRLQKQLAKNISFKRTEFMAIEISVKDKDPIKAASIANDYAFFLDSAVNHAIKERAKQAFNILDSEFKLSKAKVALLKDSLSDIMSKGIYDYESQSEVYAQAYAEAITLGNNKGASRIKSELDTLAKYGSVYISLRAEFNNEIQKLNDLTKKYNEAKINATKSLPKIFVINNAVPADERSEPKRKIIVLAITLSTIILGFIVLLGRDTVLKLLSKNEQ